MLEELIDDTMTCLGKYLILVADGFNEESKAPIPMRFVPRGKVPKIDGGEVDLLNLVCGEEKLKKAGPGEDFEGYWCHYAAGSTFYTLLGKASSVMFTATMNGCSFGIGMPSPTGELLVGHSNLPGANESGQNQILTQNIPSAKILSGSQYRGSEVKGDDPVHGTPGVLKTMNDTTTFGVFRKSKWVFYTQMYCRKTVIMEYINRMTQKPMRGTENKVHLVKSEKICSRKFNLV